MARRNSSGGSLSKADLLRSVLKQSGMQGNRPPLGLDLLGPDDQSASGVGQVLPKVPPPGGHRKWSLEFKSALNMYPRKSYGTTAPAFSFYEIDGVYANGMITGTYKDHSTSYKVFADCKSDRLPGGCSCKLSNGKHPCTHSYYFIQHILNHIARPESPLARRIDEQEFNSGKPDMDRFKFDESVAVLSMIDDLANDHEYLLESESASNQLPEVTVREPSRVAWNFEVHRYGITLEPILQVPLKRGGYGKGRKVKPDALFQGDIQLSPADQRVRNIFERDRDDFYGSYDIDAGLALSYLVGQPNVQLNGEPASVVFGDCQLTLVLKDRKFRFQMLTGFDNESQVLFADGFGISVDVKKNQLSVQKMERGQFEIIQKLVEAPPIPEQHQDELLERVKKLQNMVNLRLPESISGPVVPNTVKPLIILRSRKDGALDYGIRVRDTRDKILLPGEGLLLHATTRDDKPIQLVRSPEKERAAVVEVANQLGVDSGNADGTVHGFEASLDFVGRLQGIESGVELLWDKSSETPLKMLGTVSASNVRVGISQKRDWFNLTGECKLGDETLDIATLMQGLREAGESEIRGQFVKVGDIGWARISDELRKNLKALDDSINQERGALRFDKTSAHALREIQKHLQVDASKAWNDCLKKLERAEKLEPTLPTGLKATLRDYQVDGFKWLRRLAEWGVGGVLADDMGLGKTVQTLAAVLDRASEGPALVIAPTSVCFNWMRETEKFAPELTANMYRETDRSDFLDTLGPNKIVVCSYGLALRDADKLAKVEWATMVLDEAQAIKNSRSKTSLAIANIPSKWTVALTGTPVENHLGELWSLFHVVSPGVLGGWEQFRNRFAGPIEKNNDDDRRIALKNRLTPFILRRTKGEVLKDLPARTEMNLYVELSPAERAVYDQVRMSAIGEVDSIAKLPEIQDQRFRILALLTRLRQLACHPKMVHESWAEGSAKLTQLQETLQQLREEGHRVLIFSQFVKHLALIREMLDAEKISYQYLDGQTSAADRQKEVDKFQNGDATAFLISLKAGGTGLNLTAADYVIHMDPWWNPAVEDQATDRAHRIGQDKPVMVYRIVAQNTIEEEILRLHDTKRDLVAGVLDGTHSAGKLSTDDLIALLRS